MKEDVRALWAQTRILLWPDELILASFHVADGATVVPTRVPTEGFFAVVVERDEISLTCTPATLERIAVGVKPTATAGPYRAITLDLPIDLGVCGYLLPAAERLAAAGVSIVPQCAYLRDHVLVRSEDAAAAVTVLQRLIDESSAAGRR
jgi:hypothetical protein